MQIVLVRHGETEWSRSGQHTSRTDLSLTEKGRERAELLGPALAEWNFGVVLTSPLRRARETCQIAGFAGRAEICEDLREWDYGEYEGLTTREIHRSRPDWLLWRDGCPGGELPQQVGARADRVLGAVAGTGAPLALFSHGHMLRVIGARWIALEASGGARLGLSPAGVSVLGHERDTAIIARWNDTGADRGEGV
jgi:broad specificity phosphatase PhoE